MAGSNSALSPERAALIQWTARLGAVTAESLAISRTMTLASARGQLQAAVRAGLLTYQRPLADRPALYVVSRAGMRRCDLRGLDRCRVSAATAGHMIACASVAGALERCYPDCRVLGERELRRDERELGGAVASASMGANAHGKLLMHRPDLVLSPDRPHAGLPVAIEVELTVKAPRRLTDICRAWSRCGAVAGVLYIAPPEVARALARAIARASAEERIVVVGLDALPHYPPDIHRTSLAECPRVPSQAIRNFVGWGINLNDGDGTWRTSASIVLYSSGASRASRSFADCPRV